MMKRANGVVAAMLLVASCIQGTEVKSYPAEQARREADAAAAKKAADEKAAADAAAAKKAADEKAAQEAAAAEKLAKATISITSSSAEAIGAFNLGFEMIESGHLAQGLERFQHALSLDPNFLLAQSYLYTNLPGAAAMKNVTGAAAAGAALPEAERTELRMNAAYKSGDAAKGDELTARLAALAPADWRAWLEVGTISLRARNLDAAKAAFQRAAELNPDAFSPHSSLAAIAYYKGDHETEIAEDHKAIAARPSDPVLQDDLAVSLISAGRFDEAAAALGAEQQMAGAGWDVHATLSAVDILRGDFAAGIKELQTAYRLASDDETLYDLQSSLLFAQLAAKKHADALKTAAAVEKSAKDKNGNYFIIAAINRALVEIDHGQYAVAAASLNEALQRTDKEALSGVGRAALRREVFELLAWSNASAGKAAEARAAADALTKEAGEDASTDKDLASMVAFAQGQALLAGGDVPGAVAAMAKCIPDNDLCRWALASAQEKAGDAAGATATRNTLIALNHSYPLALWVRTRIAPAPAPGPKPAGAKRAAR